MDWSEFIEKNKSILSENYGWELMFVDKVLSKVPTLRPENIECQFPFLDGEGRNRRMDFAIREGEHVRIAIEVDGYDKSGAGGGMSRREMEDFSYRQNALIQQGWHVLRFQNGQITHQPNACIKDIGRTLLLARRNAVDLASKAPNQVVQKVNVTAPSASHLKWVWPFSAVAALGLIVLLVNFSGEKPTNNDAIAAEPQAQKIESVTPAPQQDSSVEVAKVSAAESITKPTKPTKSVNETIPAKITPEKTLPVQNQISKIWASEAKDHVGEDCVVCGQVNEVFWAANKEGRPTYLNYGAAFPKNNFSAKIDYRVAQQVKDKYGNFPRDIFEGRQVCVRGMIELIYKKPAIIINNVQQLDVIK